MPDSDSLYHRLFAHPRMVEGLVREFVPPRLVADLDFSGLQRVNPKFHSGRRSARRREGDVIWRLPTREGSELIALSPDSAQWPWQPQVRYHLLDMWAFPKDKLARRSSLVALLFRFEQQYSPEGLKDLLDEVIGWFRRHEGHERLQGLFTELIRVALARRGMKLSGSGNLLEAKTMKTMFLAHLEDWKEQWCAKARAEALAKGEAKGKAEALIYILAERFGAVAPSWQKRIRGAKPVTVERWFKRAIVAPDLPSVFNQPR